MTENDFHNLLHRRISQISVGASAIRNQGQKGDSGLIKSCRDYFESKIDIPEFFRLLSDEDKYGEFLNRHTNAILDLFPHTAKSWGAARKGLNLFLRDLTYNKYFADKFNLPTEFHQNNKILKYLEVPLDRHTATGLRKHFNGELPRWESIKSLTISTSNKYQTKATMLAKRYNIARVHLDLVFWRDKK